MKNFYAKIMVTFKIKKEIEVQILHFRVYFNNLFNFLKIYPEFFSVLIFKFIQFLILSHIFNFFSFFLCLDL